MVKKCSLYIYLSYSNFYEKQCFLIVHCSQTKIAINLKLGNYTILCLKMIFAKSQLQWLIGRYIFLTPEIAILPVFYTLHIRLAGKKKNCRFFFKNKFLLMASVLGASPLAPRPLQPGGFAPGLQRE